VELALLVENASRSSWKALWVSRIESSEDSSLMTTSSSSLKLSIRVSAEAILGTSFPPLIFSLARLDKRKKRDRMHGKKN